ncbi:hypothetical protein GCM10011317_50560 [Niveispirillum cyanobacteriorum]|nr:hypothetical protein GCM10011317_50560 [Niveispirillum cyanobacteriorum]
MPTRHRVAEPYRYTGIQQQNLIGLRYHPFIPDMAFEQPTIRQDQRRRRHLLGNIMPVSVMHGVDDLNQGGGQQAGNLEQGAGIRWEDRGELTPTLPMPPSPAFWGGSGGPGHAACTASPVCQQ